MSDRDPLEDLLLDAAEVDRARLALVLQDLIGIDGKTGKLVLKPGFNSLTSRRKVLVILLGAQASHLLGKAETQSLRTAVIIEQSGMPRGTVAPKLSELTNDRRISQEGPRGAYYVTGPQILKALDEFEARAQK